eukprot:3514498-Prymnesium_polylepis.1
MAPRRGCTGIGKAIFLAHSKGMHSNDQPLRKRSPTGRKDRSGVLVFLAAQHGTVSWLQWLRGANLGASAAS